jgi:KUP system potassium uptake protein
MQSNDKKTSALTLAALGVVFGDIGTSPLYAMRECFTGHHGVALTEANVLGVLSLIIWSLIIVVTIKYLMFVMRADNRGEGGILALMSLLHPRDEKVRKFMHPVVALGLIGAVLLYGDGIITPAVTVLGAIEGLKEISPVFESFVIVIALAILVLLFLVQKNGTAKIGKVFGPIILLWFATLAVMGINGIIQYPAVFAALSPLHGADFLIAQKFHGFVVLGSVFLVVTGGEALYADMGHFGLRPIQLGWFLVALPSLLIHYFGQGALLIANPAAVTNPFYALAPDFLLYPLVLLASMAAVIASQALITGAFSLSQQAIHLGFLPRLQIKHTSADEKGQIYIPFVNWALLIGTVFLVVTFRSSSALASAYGIAVTGTMAITTILTTLVARRLWKWNVWAAGFVCATLLSIDLAFLGANALKILSGGWFPLLFGAIIFAFMTTWKRGRTILAKRMFAAASPIESFVREVVPSIKFRVPGHAVILTGRSNGTPPALIQNVKHNKVLHETVILLTIVTEDVPHVGDDDRLSVESIGANFFRAIAHYGFMDTPHVPDLVKKCKQQGIDVDPATAIYMIGRETVIATNLPGMALWREHLFAFMSRNAQNAMVFFHLPPKQVIEIGVQVQI